MKKINDTLINKKERYATKKRDDLLKKATEYSLKQVKHNLDQFTEGYPHVSTKLNYTMEENNLWTASFFPGMTYLSYELTNDPYYLKSSDDYMKSFLERLSFGHTQTHDIGFLISLSCVANYKLTGNKEAKRFGMLGAELLSRRYHEKGYYIQAWNEMGCNYPDVKIIIDTMLNLPLLFWTGEEKYIKIAKRHAYTSREYLIREDASSFHTYLMDPVTGEAVIGKTHQGHADGSTWARGQGWAVYGFALCYAYTKDQSFLDTACKCANYYLEHLPADFIPYWDLDFTDDNPDIKDSSAGAILACGLLELCRHLDGEKRKLYYQAALCIVQSLSEHYLTEDRESNGILKEGMYHRNDGFEECVIWGDYFFMEALTRLQKPDWNRYW